MGQDQRHRGKHPEDTALFSPRSVPILRNAVADLSFLLTRNYSQDAALKLVGDHFQLHVRQRRAVLRAACSDASLEYRRRHELPLQALAGQPVAIDGYNLLISVESVLARGILLRGRDGYVRDMASIHGSYRKVEETLPAIDLIGQTLAALRPASVLWYFDAPVSNSGTLKKTLLEQSAAFGWNWQIELVNNPDRRLADGKEIVLTGDSWILDRAPHWTNLIEGMIRSAGAHDDVIDLGAAL